MTEMEKLDAGLTELGVAHFYDRNYIGGEQIFVIDDSEELLFDAICTKFSYGGKVGALEVRGRWLIGKKDVEGWLSAEDVLKIVRKKTTTQNAKISRTT